MLPILQIGPLALPVPQFSILLAFWLGLSLAEKNAHKHALTADRLSNLVFTSLITGIIGARLGYVIQSLPAFFQSPVSIFSLNPSMLDPISGSAWALVGMLIFGQRKNFSLWDTLDALTPLLAVMGIGLAFSHIASGESFGSPTNLPWGIYLWGENRHPAQFYELFAAATIFSLMISKKIQLKGKPGSLFLAFWCLTAASNLFLEAFHGDSATLFSGFRTTQIIAWVALALGLPILNRCCFSVEFSREGHP